MFSFVPRVGVDLGTANSLVYVQGRGIVLNEPTVVAVGLKDNRVIAVGNEAKEMLGRTPVDIVAHRPLRDGVIADYTVTEAMLRYFLGKVGGRVRFFKPEAMVSAPAGISSVERRAVLEATLSAGAQKAYLIDEALAAAVGAGVPIAEASGNMVVDIGGGTMEAAVISLGGAVVEKMVRAGGNRLDDAIGLWLKHKHALLVGERMAEEIKIAVGAALPLEEELSMQVRGRSAQGGLPRSLEIKTSEVLEAIQPVLTQMIGGIKAVLEKTPPELASDVVDKGMVLTGGTSQLRGLDRLITQETGVPAHLAEDPALCVAKGIGVAIEHLGRFKRSVMKK